MSATCTVIFAAVMLVPSTVAVPATLSVRPVTVTSEPFRTSWTRYPASESPPTVHSPDRSVSSRVEASRVAATDGAAAY